MQDHWIGKTIGKCRLEKFIGAGGMGAVYRSRHLLLDKIVALKLLHPNLVNEKTGKEITERFIREAQSAAKLEHPNIVHIYDIGEDNGLYYMVMQFIAGKTLLELIKEKGILQVDVTLNIAKNVARGLQAAHSKGIVHRDIKPANILITNDHRVKITDFGLAKQVDDQSHISQVGRVFGTPLYLSPEQALGEAIIDGRADLYSLGISIFQSLTGTLPYSGITSFVIMQQHVCSPIPSLKAKFPEIPEDVEYLVHKLMAKNRDDRFTCAEEVINYIDEIEGSLPPDLDEHMRATESDYQINFGFDKIPQTRRIAQQTKSRYATRRFGARQTEIRDRGTYLTRMSDSDSAENLSPEEKHRDKTKFRVIIGKSGVECVPDSRKSEALVDGSQDIWSKKTNRIDYTSHVAPEAPALSPSEENRVAISNSPDSQFTELAPEKLKRVKLTKNNNKKQETSTTDSYEVEFLEDFHEIPRQSPPPLSSQEKIRIQLGPSGVELQKVKNKHPRQADDENSRAISMPEDRLSEAKSDKADQSDATNNVMGEEEEVVEGSLALQDIILLAVFIAISLLLFGWLLLYS